MCSPLARSARRHARLPGPPPCDTAHACSLCMQLLTVSLLTQVKAMMAAAQVAIAEVGPCLPLSHNCLHMLQSHHVASAQHADARR